LGNSAKWQGKHQFEDETLPTNSANSSAPKTICWLVVEPTHLKNISQIGPFPQVKVKIKNA